MKKYLTNLLKIGGLFCVCVFLFCTAVYAEGSRDMTSSGEGYRPYTEYDSNSMAGVTRQTVLSVYAQEGEEILLGTSQWDSYDGNDILVTAPSGTVTNIDVEAPYRYTGFSSWEYYAGHIATKEMEEAGPNYNGNNSDGYTPYIYNVRQTGIYTVCFHGQTETGGGNNPEASLLSREDGKFQPERSGYDLLGSFRKNDNTASTVAAWDISVYRNGEYVPGRVFTKHLSLNTGDSGAAVNSSVYVLTTDGYEYKVDLNGIDPFGFIFYGNNRGLVDLTNNRTVYKNAVTESSEDATAFGDLIGNLLAPRPSATDYGKNRTYNIFFNRPANDLPSSIPIKPQSSATFEIRSIESNATSTEGETPEGAGFTANVDFSKTCTYTMVVDVNQNGQYDPGDDAIIRDAASAGTNEIVWDGKTDSGAVVPGGSNVNIIIYVKAGEIHLPFIDVENNSNGIKIELINGDENIVSNHGNLMYYDNREYTTANGTVIDSDKGLDPAAMVPAYYFDNSRQSPSGGANGLNGAGSYINNYGDNKVIDYWTYVRGYDNKTDADNNSSTYVQSDGIYNDVYCTYEDFKILDDNVEYGRINGFVYYDGNANGAYDYEEGDVAFTASFPVTVVSRYGNDTLQRVVYSSETGGNFTAAIPLNSGLATDYEIYIIISDEVAAYIDDLKITEGGELITVHTDDEYKITEGGTERKAIKFEGSLESGTYNIHHNIGLALAELPDAELSISLDKRDYALGENVTYIVNVTNRDDNIDITNVRVSIPVLSGHNFVRYESNSGEYDPGTGIWQIGSMPSNTTYTLKVISTINRAGTYIVKADFTAYNYDSQNSVVNAEKEYTVQEEPLKEALFEFTDAKVTNDNEVLVVGQLSGSDDEMIIADNSIAAIGFVATKDITELQKSISDFDENSDSVFYIECTEMYNKVYDTSGYIEENIPVNEKDVIYNGGEKYYGAGVFENMLADLQSNTVYYIQGVTKYDGDDKLVRENDIHEISIVGTDEIQINNVSD